MRVFITNFFKTAETFSQLVLFPPVHDLLTKLLFVIINSSYRSVEDEEGAVIESEMMDFYVGDFLILDFYRVKVNEQDLPF